MSKLTNAMEVRIVKAAVSYVKSGGNLTRLFYLIEINVKAAKAKPESKASKAKAPKTATKTESVKAERSRPFPLNSVFADRIGSRIVGMVKVGEYAGLADQAENGMRESREAMRVWARLNQYAKENELDPKAATYTAVPSRVLASIIRKGPTVASEAA